MNSRTRAHKTHIEANIDSTLQFSLKTGQSPESTVRRTSVRRSTWRGCFFFKVSKKAANAIAAGAKEASCCHGPRRPGAPSGAEKSVGGHNKFMEDVLDGGSVRRSTSAVSICGLVEVVEDIEGTVILFQVRSQGSSGEEAWRSKYWSESGPLGPRVPQKKRQWSWRTVPRAYRNKEERSGQVGGS
jgi:hypothetical protein